MSTVLRSALMGLFALLVTLVAVGSLATTADQPWLWDLLYVPPVVGGMAAALAHPGPRAGGRVSFLVSVLLAPVLVQASEVVIRSRVGSPPLEFWYYPVYPALALAGSLVVLLLRRDVRRRAAAAEAAERPPTAP